MMMGYGFGGLGLLLMILFWIVVIALAVWLVSSMFPKVRESAQDRDEQGARTPLEVLKMRYARGEITRAEFEEMRATLGGGE